MQGKLSSEESNARVVLAHKSISKDGHVFSYNYEENFNLAHAHVEKAEGKLVDHKSDPGGITKYGISLRFLEDYSKTENGRAVLNSLKIFTITRNSIVQLRQEQAKHILYNAFWLSPQIDKLPQRIAIVIYDFAVNSGSYYAIRLLQKAIGAKIDGIIGKETIIKAALASTTLSKEKQIIKFLLEERVKFYIRLSKSKPAMQVFLNGWLARVENLRIYINQIINEQEKKL